MCACAAKLKVVSSVIWHASLISDSWILKLALQPGVIETFTHLSVSKEAGSETLAMVNGKGA